MRVERCFAFVDLSGFTAFTERYGDEQTVVVLARFRTRIREIAARRGVRVAKWLGDGAMLSSSDTEAIAGMVIELAAVTDEGVPLPLRAGIAQGAVIMFEGDDYIGRATNVAARLCDAAKPGEVLVTREVASYSPRWVSAGPSNPYTAQGFDRPLEACLLTVAPGEPRVADAWCGLNLPAGAGLETRFDEDGSILRFCSAACASSWEQEQRKPLVPISSE